MTQSSSPSFQQHKQLMMKRMREFCETKHCRRNLLLSYFDDPLSTRTDVPRPNCCDNCDKLLYMYVKWKLLTNDIFLTIFLFHTRRNYSPRNTDGVRIQRIDLTEETRLLLSVFDYFRGRFGLVRPIKFLRGAKDGRFTENQMASALYGAGKQHTEAAWKELGT